MSPWVGLVGIGLALLCGVGFVAATVRADARVHAVAPASTSGFRGLPRVWALAAVLLAVGSVLLLAHGVVTGWAPLW